MEKHLKTVEGIKELLKKNGEKQTIFETHISTVILSGDYVYKIKKPVDMGFLDFTTPESRLLFCRREVTLNKKLAPDIYFGVFPIFEKDGQTVIGENPLPLDEDGEGGGAEEWLVKMKRLPDEIRFKSLLNKNELTLRKIDELAELLVKFHDENTLSPDNEWGNPSAFEFNMNENFVQMKPFVGEILDANQYSALSLAAAENFNEVSALIASRRENGKLVDGHGDLHLEHIYASEPLCIIDCLEFAERFRIADRTNDIAFLSMDFDKNNAPLHAHRLVRHYVSFSDDIELLKLLPTYKAYLAVVRSKIHCITASQRTDAGEKALNEKLAKEYFNLAESYLETAQTKPKLAIVGGIIGSGKSTLASAYADKYKAVVLSSDIVRKTISGISPYERREVPLDSDIYSPENTQKTYLALADRAKKLIKMGMSPVIDASFSKKEHRTVFANLAEDMGVEIKFFYTNCEKDETLKRLENRSQQSHRVTDGRAELYDALSDKFEVPTADEKLKTIDSDTTHKSPEEIISEES